MALHLSHEAGIVISNFGHMNDAYDCWLTNMSELIASWLLFRWNSFNAAEPSTTYVQV